MSDDDDISSYRVCYKKDEHYLFVTLLAKYKVLLRTEKSPEVREQKLKAATALASEYNMQCERKFTVEQVFKKVYNMKGRLRTKNFKNLGRSKKLAFNEWERLFLDLWIENGLTSSSKRNTIYDIVMASQTQANITEASSQHAGYKSESQTDECSALLNDASKSECYISEGFIIPDTVKVETDEYNTQATSDVQGTPVWAVDSEFDGELMDEEDEIQSYGQMSLKDLKRAALIAQIESHKAQKAAAEAQKSAAESQREAAEINKHLNEYQLTFLRRQNGDD